MRAFYADSSAACSLSLLHRPSSPLSSAASLRRSARLPRARCSSCPRLARSASIKSMTWPPASGRGSGDRDLLAFHFLLDLGLDARLDLVGVRVGVEAVARLAVDELLGELQLCVACTGASSTPSSLTERTSAPKCSWCMRERVADRPHDDDVILPARGPAADGATTRLTERGREQRVRLRATLVRARGSTCGRSTPGPPTRAARTRRRRWRGCPPLRGL